MSSAGRRTALLCALLAASAHAVEAGYAVSARADVRTRSPLPGDRSTFLTGDLEFVPDGLVGLRWRTALISLQYNPSLLLREPHLLGRVIFLHRGRFTATARWDRSSLTFVQEGAYGQADVGALRNPDGSLPGSVPEVQTVGAVPYVRSASYLTFETRPDDRTSLSVAGGYLLSGSPVETPTLPLQWGPTASARFRWAATRLDGASLHAQANAAWFATGAQQVLALATVIWDHQWSRTLSTTLGAGAAFTREVIVAIVGGPIPGTYTEALPVVTATATWRQESQLRFDLTTRMAPFADRFTGFIYERVEGRVQAEWRPFRPLTVIGSTGLAWAVPVGRSEQAGDRLFFGEGGLAWTPNDWFLLGFSTRILWTEQPRLMTPGQLQWVGTFSLTVRNRGTTTW